MTNWNKVKHNQLPRTAQYSDTTVVYVLLRNHDYHEHKRKGDTVPLSVHSIYKRRFEAERQANERNEHARSDYWWVKPVVMNAGRIE